MSRAYDAKQAALKAHPEDKQAGVDMFLGYLNCSYTDFEYEYSESVEDYIYGGEK